MPQTKDEPTSIQDRAAEVLQQIDAALALAEKATPGPWTHRQGEFCSHWISRQDELSNIAEINTESVYTSPNVAQNAAFIAASRNGWPASLRMNKTAIEGLLKDISYCETRAYNNFCASNMTDRMRERLTTLCDQWENR